LFRRRHHVLHPGDLSDSAAIVPAQYRHRVVPGVTPDEVGLFQGIVEHLGGVVLVCDARGAVHWANSRASEWLGADAVAPAAALETLAQLGALALPWTLGVDELARVCAGATLRLRPESLRGADGVVRRCGCCAGSTRWRRTTPPR
jgi:hypothetical protein